MNSASARPPGLRGVHVFWGMFAFFAAITAVDVVFIVRAVSTFPGEDVRNSYVQGNDYNATLRRHQEQRALGWSAQAGLETLAGQPAFAVRLSDAAGKSVTDKVVELRWRRVGVDEDERTLSLKAGASGDYSAAFAVEGPGRVSAVIDVRNAAGEAVVFSAVKTITLPAAP